MGSQATEAAPRFRATQLLCRDWTVAGHTAEVLNWCHASSENRNDCHDERGCVRVRAHCRWE
jgi:hypothetical protein